MRSPRSFPRALPLLELGGLLLVALVCLGLLVRHLTTFVRFLFASYLQESPLAEQQREFIRRILEHLARPRRRPRLAPRQDRPRRRRTVPEEPPQRRERIPHAVVELPEPLKLASRDDVEKHFRATHLADIVRQVETHDVPGPTSRVMPCRGLQRLVRQKWQDQQRFPLELATLLSHQFASQGLHFFKVNKITHVSVVPKRARPSSMACLSLGSCSHA